MEEQRDDVRKPEVWENNVIDVQVDEARKLAAIQMQVNMKFRGKPKDIKVWAEMRDELTTRIAEAGFVAKVHLDTDASGNWIPVVDIIGRADKHLQDILNREGEDIEHKSWDAHRVTSAQLEREGVNTGLL